MSSDVGTLIFKAPEFWDKKQGEQDTTETLTFIPLG